ncbi:MAG: carboxy terminal-processing peptidase [Oligoflexia bacterium]|nr:carboxy terminal-processing peptidase [Oligoflexia bacterium]
MRFFFISIIICALSLTIYAGSSLRHVKNSSVTNNTSNTSTNSEDISSSSTSSSSSSNSSDATTSKTDKTDNSQQQLRDQLLGNMIKNRLEMMHFSQKEFNADLSEKAFALYLERLDYSKQFLLQEDIEYLSKYKKSISDSLSSGEFILMKEGSKILKQRVNEVSQIAETLLKTPFDFNVKEVLENDPKKRSFCKTKAELTDLWRKVLKLTVLNNYLTMLEEAKELSKSTSATNTSTNTSTNSARTNTKGKKVDAKCLHSQSKKCKKQKSEAAATTETATNKTTVATAAATATVAATAADSTPKTPEEMLKKSIENTLKNYRRIFLRLQQQDHDDELEIFFNALTMVFDPHTTYLAPQDKEDFDIQMKGSLEGIGALLQEDGQYIKVVTIIPGSASWRQKELEPEDTILKVGQDDGTAAVDVVNMRINDAVKLIRGPRGSKVKLTVKKSTGEIKVITIVRDVVQIKSSYAKGILLENADDGTKFGYIRLPMFYRDFEAQTEGKEGRNCTDDVRAILEKFNKEKVTGMILDLRDNGGGALEDAKLMSGLFIEKGPIVQTRQSKGGKDVLYDSDDEINYKGQVIVLVNRLSASASEILAAALQDYERAIIIGGDHTHGKGTVQVFLNLDQGLSRIAKNFLPLGALKITIQKFYRIAGSSTQYKGVTPDIILPDRLEAIETGEKFLDYSLKWDEVRPISFDKWTLSELNLAKLTQNSRKRVQSNEKFQKMQKIIEIIKKRKDDTQVNLNIDDLKAKQEKLKEENKIYKIDKVNEKILVFKEKQGHFKKIDFPKENESDSDLSSLSNKKKKAIKGRANNIDDEDEDWISDLRKDPFIEESLNVLKDLVILNQKK